MPVTTETTEDFEGIVQTGYGLVTGDELVCACHAAFQLVQNTKNFHYEFVDLSEATALEFAEEDLDKITTRDRLTATYRPDAIVVIVAPRDDFYELGKIWESRVRDLGWATHVARDRAEGLRWLKENFPRPAAKPDTEMFSHPAAAKQESRIASRRETVDVGRHAGGGSQS